MNLPIKTITVIVLVLLVLVTVAALFISNISISETKAKNIFTQGCIKYCNEIEQSQTKDIGIIAIEKAEELDNSDFIMACKTLYPEIDYNWQCWNRDCCKFSVYPPI